MPIAAQIDPEVIPGLRREWMVLVRRRRLIMVIAAVSIASAAVYNYAALPMYEGTAVVSAGEAIPTQPYARMNVDVGRLEAVINKEIARITSRELATRVIALLGDVEKRELARGPIGPWYRRLRFSSMGNANDGGTLKVAEAVGALRSRVTTRWREPSTWIEVRVSGFDPEATATLANALIRVYVTETAASNRETLDASKTAFETQLHSKEKQLGEQLSGLRDLGSTTGLGDFGARKAILERQVHGFQDALVAAQTARVGRAGTRREGAVKGGAINATDPRIQTAQSRMAELEDRERALLATLGAKHPEVVTVQEQLQIARERLEALNVSLEKEATSSYQLALNEEARIEANLQRVQRELETLESESFSYTMTQKKADASRAGVDQLLRLQELAAPVIITAEIIQTATPSAVPSSPRKWENFTYAIAIGLLAGLVLAWGLDRFDDSIQSPDDIKDILGLPFLGVVPLVRELLHKTIAAALSDTRTGFSDGLRVVRTNLIYGALELKPKVLVFTSASPGDGKSTVASGVALLLNETRARVLLIDGDLRRPSLPTLLGVPPSSPGLSDLLGKAAPVTLVAATGPIRGVDVLSSGPPLTVSAALLGSENMRSLIEQARARYDWVIIDSPPSLGLPDASVLATLADGVVVVCSGDKTPRQALRSVADQLRSVGASVLGVVLNRVDMDRHSYYYGRHYSVYYGTGEKRPPQKKKVS